MSEQVKVECEGIGQRSHKSRLVAQYGLSVATGWQRLDDPDYDGWFLPEGTPFRHEWAANTPSARHKITCTCDQSAAVSYDNLVKILDWARSNNKSVPMSLLKRMT